MSSWSWISRSVAPSTVAHIPLHKCAVWIPPASRIYFIGSGSASASASASGFLTLGSSARVKMTRYQFCTLYLRCWVGSRSPKKEREKKKERNSQFLYSASENPEFRQQVDLLKALWVPSRSEARRLGAIVGRDVATHPLLAYNKYPLCILLYFLMNFFQQKFSFLTDSKEPQLNSLFIYAYVIRMHCLIIYHIKKLRKKRTKPILSKIDSKKKNLLFCDFDDFTRISTNSKNHWNSSNWITPWRRFGRF